MNVRQGYPAPIAYTYEASEHCAVCTAERFGVDEDGWIPESARDAVGNPIGAIAPWDEWTRSLVCGTCCGVIREDDDDEYEEEDVRACFPSLPDLPTNAADACRRAREAWSRTFSQLAFPFDV